MPQNLAAEPKRCDVIFNADESFCFRQSQKSPAHFSSQATASPTMSACRGDHATGTAVHGQLGKNSGGGTGVEVSGMPPSWREHLKNLLAARSVRITTRPLLTQLAASAGHRAPEAGRLHSAPRYRPHRAQAHSVLRHAMHPGTVGPLANRPRPRPPVETGSRPRSCNHRLASRSRCSVRRQNNLWYLNVMPTPEIAITGPGTLALNCRPMHSSG
jgi:hypothetical protein